MRLRFVLCALVLWPACGDDQPPTSDTDDASSGAPVTTSGTSSAPATSTGTTTGDPPPPPASTSGSSNSDGADSTSDETGRPGTPGLAFEMLTIDEPIVRATAIAFFPDSSDFLLVSKDGDIVHYALEGDAATRLGGFTLPGVYTPSDCGAISLAFDPDFIDNRLFYVGYCRSQFESAIVRLELGADLDYDAVVATMADVIVVGHPSASEPWHNVGSIGFDPAGNLWAVFGDKTVPSSAQDLASNLGSIIRIVPDRSPGGSGYTAARDNPFYGDPDLSWDIWAYGLRSPWKALLDDQGRFFIGDVGSDEFEEIDMVDAPGENLAWPLHEGLCDADCTDLVDPITTWPHAAHPYIEDDPLVEPANARVAWVGAAYRDRGNDPYEGLLTGRVLFGDSCLGYVRAIEVDAGGTVVFDEYLGHLVAPTSWAQAPDGYLYVTTYGGCGSGSIDPDDPPRVQLLRAVLSR